MMLRAALRLTGGLRDYGRARTAQSGPTLALAGRPAQRILHAPPPPQARQEGAVPNAAHFRPFSRGPDDAFVLNESVRRQVSRLLRCGCPTTVVRPVAPPPVDPVHSAPGRSLAHVGEEIVKALPPSIADDNASGAVLMERRRLRIVTALNHRRPRAIGGAQARVGSMPVPITLSRATAGARTVFARPTGHNPRRDVEFEVFAAPCANARLKARCSHAMINSTSVVVDEG